MTITITLPESIEAKLQQRAKRQQLSITELILNILDDVLEEDDFGLSLDEVVAKIQALPPNPNNIRPAIGSLAEALRESPTDPTFNLAEWQQEWQTIA